MIITFQRGSKHKRNQVKSLTKFIANKLMPRMAKKLFIEFEFVTGLHKREDIFGDISIYEDDVAPRDFLIRLDAGILEFELLKTVAHEMIHVKQISRQELKELVRTPYFRFHNKYYPKTISYFDRPWEIEALGRQEGLVVQWLNKKGENNGNY